MRIVAGIDMGTQSIKTVLYDWESKKIVAKSQVPVDIIAENDGTREQKTEWYDKALAECFAAFTPEQKACVSAVGVSGHQHGFVPLDENGKALYNVKLWNDTTTAEECRLITEAAGGEDAVIAETCNLMLPGFTAPKILWLKRHKKEAFDRLRYIMLPHNYLNYLLCGAYNTESGDASGMALYNGAEKRWSEKICACIDSRLHGLLPPVIESDAPCGYVTEKASALFGIPAGIPVSSGGGDNMMSAIGTGTVRDGFLTISLGTSGTLFGYSDSPVADPRRGVSGFNSSTGGYLPLLCTMNCTVATEETRTLFDLGVKDFDSLAEAAVPGADGIVFLPFFNGERTPNLPHGKACICGVSAANCSRGNIARAAMESAIFGMRQALDVFRELGFSPKEIRLTGGGSKSPLWRQITADIMQLPVKLPDNDEAAAMGGAIQALWCLKKLEGNPVSISDLVSEHIGVRESETVLPDAAAGKAYDKAFEIYTAYLNSLSPMWV